MSQDESIQGRHLTVYTSLCQLIIAIITFYCAIAISHYDPTPASAVPRAVAPQTSFSNANSTTSYICKTDGLGAILIAITPYCVLCPSTPFFFLSLISFVFGIFRFNSLHTEDIDLIDGYSYFIFAGVLSLDWQDVLVSVRVTMPIMIWSATLLLPIGHWLFKTFLPGTYWRYRQAMRLQREALWKAINCRGETVGDVEAGEAVEGGDVGERINEETPLRRDEGREY
ncbi:hypothetical protein DM02DRAFT_678092 [Periconia macrospinosa]|uniref:Uncharacterized protein n=1 Tax=Periconia macrospinosa TaxID=97972 RepID=A0A2V1D069_9PLEO|nr:hypothetical protein DM02DRAFT_678092 [Periconia macrospinosa]